MPDIARERRLLKEQGLDMRLRGEWGARFNYTTDRDCDIAEVFFLHIAVVDDPGDLIGTEDQVARNIENIGISRFPSTGISYNALSFNTGRLYEGQPLTRRGAHTVNDFRRSTCPTHGGSLVAPSWNNNVNARALCLPQNVDDPVTDAQIDSAARWAAAQIRAGLARRDARWHGHRDVSAKSCPGDKGFERIPELDRLTDQYVKNGLGDDMPTPKDLWEKYQIPATSSFKTEWSPQVHLRNQSVLMRVLIDLVRKVLAQSIDDQVGRDAPQRQEVREVLAALDQLGDVLREQAVDVGQLAQQIVDRMPDGTVDQAVVEAGVRAVLTEGVTE